MNSEKAFKQAIIKRCNAFSWFDETLDDKTAYAVLQSIRDELTRMTPSNKLDLGERRKYFSYIWNLTHFVEAMAEHKYCRACNEIAILLPKQNISLIEYFSRPSYNRKFIFGKWRFFIIIKGKQFSDCFFFM